MQKRIVTGVIGVPCRHPKVMVYDIGEYSTSRVFKITTQESTGQEVVEADMATAQCYQARMRRRGT